MVPQFRALFVLALMGAAMDSAAAAAPSATVDLVAHRAIYRMSLGTATAKSGVVGARGAMLYRFASGCDGWTGETKTYLRVQYDEGDEVEIAWTFANWESFNGLNYRFRLRNKENGRATENIQGTAILSGVGKGGKARYSQPEEVTIDLPAGTLFPTQHLRELFRAGREGSVRVSKVVFDGSSTDNPFEINVLLRRVKKEESAKIANGLGLDELPVWRMWLAFFPVGSKETLPDFEIEVRYREDGIADRIEQDFGSFTLDLTLDELELLPKPDC